MTHRTDIYLSTAPLGGPPSAGAAARPSPPPSPEAFRAAVRECDASVPEPTFVGEIAARSLRDSLIACMEGKGYRLLSASGVRIAETRRGESGAPQLSAYVALSDPAWDSQCHHEARRRLITSRVVGDSRRMLHDSLVADCQRAHSGGELVWDLVTR